MTDILPLLPVRPVVSLTEILAYSFLAFIIALLLTKPFLGFLHKYKLGKQLRVEAVDGGSASVFQTYHQKKAGTPTMGGLLIWGSIVVTVVLSRVFSLYGTVDHSLLQRGQVYIPLFTLISFGLLGAFDDYLNIAGGDEPRLKKLMPRLRKAFGIGLIILILVGIALVATNTTASNVPYGIVMQLGVFGVPLIILAFLLPFIVLGLGGAVMEDIAYKFLVNQGKRKGLGAMPKLFSLLGISLFCGLWFYFRLGYSSVHIPFGMTLGLTHTPDNIVQIGWLYVPFFMFVLLGTANAVNVTDGLDGLAGGLLIIAFGAFGLVAYVTGLTVLAGFCGVVVGALSAFLWHNVPPAAFFMGDTGSLALGGTLAIMAFMVDQVLILPLIGFIFVLEMLSVIIQLTSKKYFKRKVFKSAPFHHHLEALEWGESKVTMRLWIVGAFAAFFGVLVGIYG